MFGSLPGQVAHHILSFLAITDLARFGCVSKKCRELYLSSPSLNFDEFSLANTSTCYHRLKLLSYLDRLFYHRGDNKIQSFHVRWYTHNIDDGDVTPCFCVCENFRMYTWIENAVRCNVEKLVLEMNLYDYDREPFPSCVFLCGSLRSLTVDMLRTILTPSCAFSSNLKYLKLRHVRIKDEGFFKWVSSSCRSLEELYLQHVYGTETIAIESLSLKKFSLLAFNVISISHVDISGEKLEDILVDWIFDSPSNKSLNIHAPNLKSLIWTGNLMHLANLGKLEFLNNARILLDPEVDGLDNVSDILSSLCRAKFLSLNEVALKAPFREGSGQAPLYDVISLHLNIGNWTDALVPTMVFLFKRMPNLWFLNLESKPPLDNPKCNIDGFNIEYWKLQNLDFIYQLKMVTIGLSKGSNGIEFAKYVLECAQALMIMVIKYLPGDLEKVTMKLKECKKNSNATVFLQDKQTREVNKLFDCVLQYQSLGVNADRHPLWQLLLLSIFEFN